MKNIQISLLDLFEEEINLDYFIQLLDNNEIQEDPYELYEVLQLLLNISNNHHQTPNFFTKVFQILIHLKNDIQKNYSNYEIFDIFKDNKRILLFLIKEKIIAIDKTIIKSMMNTKYLDRNYQFYFYPEIKEYIGDLNQLFIEFKIINDSETQENEVNFEEKREVGENHSYICTLIRNDSIDEFISFTNQANVPLTTTFGPSIYETNLLLMNEESISLIEYAAFFGSIKIFKYLKLNKVKLEYSLWIYAIHSHNSELIHLLEEEIMLSNDNSFKGCFFESIKCHHNDFANYFQNNLSNQKEKVDEIDDDDFIIKSFNYDFFPDDIKNEKTLFYLCKYNYMKFVKLFMEVEDLNINKTFVLNFFLFVYQISINCDLNEISYIMLLNIV